MLLQPCIYDFNTSHVVVYHVAVKDWQVDRYDFNTSHVVVYR